MSLFEIPEKEDLHLSRAKGIIAFGNQAVTEIKRLFDMSLDMMWNVPGYTIADAQRVLDSAESLKPGLSADMFRAHGLFAEFLTRLGVLTEEQASAPVAWQPEPIPDTEPQLYRIKLMGDRYPTEPVPAEENSDQNSQANIDSIFSPEER